jgi:uroporphyrinogen decarboxylase
MSLGNDRVSRLLAGETVDAIPVFPLGIRGFAAINAGFTLADAYADGRKSCEAELAAQEQYGFDGFPNYAYGGLGAWEFGGQVRFPESEFEQAPVVVRYPAATEEEAVALGLPSDTAAAGAMPIGLAHSRRAAEAGATIITPPAGVFSTACNLCGVQQMARWMMKKPLLAHRLMGLSRDFLMRMVEVWVETFGSDIVMYNAEPSAANQVISPRHFEEFVLPYAVEVHSHALRLGIEHIMTHVCGDQNLNLQHWARIPMGDPGLLTFGPEVDLKTAIDVFGDSSIIAGNIESSLIQRGHPTELHEACHAAMRKGQHAPRGFVLMSGCGYPPRAPAFHLYTIVKAARDFRPAV